MPVLLKGTSHPGDISCSGQEAEYLWFCNVCTVSGRDGGNDFIYNLQAEKIKICFLWQRFFTFSFFRCVVGELHQICSSLWSIELPLLRKGEKNRNVACSVESFPKSHHP